jgi:hypothetical protein
MSPQDVRDRWGGPSSEDASNGRNSDVGAASGKTSRGWAGKINGDIEGATARLSGKKKMFSFTLHIVPQDLLIVMSAKGSDDLLGDIL